LTLVDAGPLVALIDSDDAYHDACVIASASIRTPMLTVWPVFAEAMYLVRRVHDGHDRLWDTFENGTFQIADLDAEDCARMRHLMRKYRDLPMDLADAALVALAERERTNHIFTIDRRGFSVYKPAGMKRFEIIP
jgi:predicted nucleic acid-binding protein